MNPLFEQYEAIRTCCAKLKAASYDCYQLFPPAMEFEIADWEALHAKLPEGLKHWYRLSNGFDMNTTADILPLYDVMRYPFADLGLTPYYIVGHYIGDGSALMMDGEGNFYQFDHAYHKLIPTQFEDFLTNWILAQLEEAMYDAGLR